MTTKNLRIVAMKDGRWSTTDHYQLFDGGTALGTLHKIPRYEARRSDPYWEGRAVDGRKTAVMHTRKLAAEALCALAAEAPKPLKLRDRWLDLTKNPEVPVVSKVEMAFPATAMDYLPPYDFLQTVGFGPNDTNAWMTLADTWFNNTRSLADRKLQLVFDEDIDMDNLRNLIHVCMGSFEPKHEHKIGGVAYMLSRWCEEYLLDGRPQVDPKWPGLIKDEELRGA